MTMMFWKLEGGQVDEAAPRQQLDTFAPPPFEPRMGYEQAALAAMRYLADALGIPHWVFLRHYRGMLAATVGIGEYQRHVPTGALPIGRLADLPTIDLLGTAATDHFRSREVARDAAAVAPYGAPIVRPDGSLFGVLCTFSDRVSSAQIEPDPRAVGFACEMLHRAVVTDLMLAEAGRSHADAREPQLHPIVQARPTSRPRLGWEGMLAAAVVASLAPAALAILGLTLAARYPRRGDLAETVSLLRRLSADDRRVLQSLLHAGL
jgi:hypothetical protein